MQEKRQEILIVGTGKVAQNITSQLIGVKYITLSVWGRNKNKAAAMGKAYKLNVLNSISEIKEKVLILLCISDDVISEILKIIPINNRVAYTSGSVQLSELPKRNQLGVFYPLQTFSEGRTVDLKNVPFLIEATTVEFEEELMQLAQQLSAKVQKADSHQRFQLHIAAVLVNNFTNYLYILAADQMKKNHLDWELLLPLIQETANKLTQLSPEEAQTGPASRGDVEIIKKHIEALEGTSSKKVYELLSELIMKKRD